MKRCKKCLMPDTIPGSNFNEQGICYWCETDFPNYVVKNTAKFKRIVASKLRSESKADCLVGLSGGKDSSYALFKLKTEYNLKVEAFIYLHDGSTQFSIDNAESICRQLNVKLHKVALPGKTHLKTFKSYFKAWLHSPSTMKAGMTCVACKYLHLLGLDIARERNIPIIIWSNSPIEYSPFLAAKYSPDKKNQFKRENAFNSFLILLKEIISSPKFAISLIQNFKVSFWGCLAAFPTAGFLKRKYPSVEPVFFYDYHLWDPEIILNTLLAKTDWKLPEDTIDDWHSDCLFNIFKEYMFQKMLGITYTDAHLSNQIRYGYLSRDEAIKQLIRSKKNLKHQLKLVVSELEMENLEQFIDYDCFNIGNIV